MVLEHILDIQIFETKCAEAINQLMTDLFSEIIPPVGYSLMDSIWKEDNAMYQSAALAYYTAVSIVPLIIIVIAITGLVFGHDLARDQIVAQIRGLIGPKGADAVNTMIEDASHSGGGIIATIIGIGILVLGSTGVFIQLHYALNLV